MRIGELSGCYSLTDCKQPVKVLGLTYHRDLGRMIQGILAGAIEYEPLCLAEMESVNNSTFVCKFANNDRLRELYPEYAL
jgi:hypothetical protein